MQGALGFRGLENRSLKGPGAHDNNSSSNKCNEDNNI